MKQQMQLFNENESAPVKYVLTNDFDANTPNTDGKELTDSKIGHLVSIDDSRFIMKQDADSTDIFAVETGHTLDPEIFRQAVGLDVNVMLNDAGDKIQVDAWEGSGVDMHRVLSSEQHLDKADEMDFLVSPTDDREVDSMASKFKQFIDDIIHGRDEPEQTKGRDEIDEIEAAHAEQAPAQDMAWLDEEVEKQRGQQMPDEAYQVSEHDEPAPEQHQEQAPEVQQEQGPAPEPLPGHEPATGEITPGQGDVEHGLEQDASMDRETMSDGLEQAPGGGMKMRM